MIFTTQSLESILAILPGKRVKIVGNGSGHSYGTNGTILTIREATIFNHAERTLKFNGVNSFIRLSEFEVIGGAVEELEKDYEELQKLIKTKASQITYMKQTKAEIYDELEFKVWSSLETARKEGLNGFELAKAVVAALR